jgi:hypothetical protein
VILSDENAWYIYTWGNSEKRQQLKGKRCCVLTWGKGGRCLVQFDDGSQHVVNRLALKRVLDQNETTHGNGRFSPDSF